MKQRLKTFMQGIRRRQTTPGVGQEENALSAENIKQGPLGIPVLVVLVLSMVLVLASLAFVFAIAD